jgi:hypothetical protein
MGFTIYDLRLQNCHKSSQKAQKAILCSFYIVVVLLHGPRFAFAIVASDF